MALISKSSDDEIRKLEAMLKSKPANDSIVPRGMSISQAAKPKPVAEKLDKTSYKERIFDNVSSLSVTKQPIQLTKGLDIDNPVKLLLLLMPELMPYKWQYEELMYIGGFFQKGVKTEITDLNPYKLCLAAANGSGKDMVIIAASAVWFALTGIRNRVIITSSSHEQIKTQTEPHIKDLIARANKVFGKIFSSIQFHHIIPELGSEIKLFATDEPGKAEGYHPFFGGKMMLIINEAKTVNERIFEAINRCTGFSHWLEISSPAHRSGHMFKAAGRAIQYPDPPQLGQFRFRRVTAFDCPHISPSDLASKAIEWGETSSIYRSSILAEFSDFEEAVVIPLSLYETIESSTIPKTGSDIGIGLDLAGGGDEDACFVRQGNTIVESFFFHQEDTDLAANLIDLRLERFKSTQYSFNADNGGIGQAIIDKLVAKGWRIRRRNNQSPAHNKREFLNLGAESWFKIKRLLERRLISIPKQSNGQSIPKFKDQLTTRQFKGMESTQGKFSLESKKEAKASGRPSPDRADAFVLCYIDYRVTIADINTAIPNSRLTPAQLLQYHAEGKLTFKKPALSGRFTTMKYGKLN